MKYKRHLIIPLVLLVLIAVSIWMAVGRMPPIGSGASIGKNATGQELQSTRATSRVIASDDGLQRGQKSLSQADQTNSPWRQLLLTKAELLGHPKSWMLAYSEEDASWQEKFGYPTMDEEAMYDSASIEQLRAMVNAGDSKARINLGMKLAEAAIKAGDPAAIQKSSLEIGRAIVEGGPYQAAKAAIAFNALAKDAKVLGNLSAESKQAINNDLLPYNELARGLSGAYDDYAAVRAFNSAAGFAALFGLPANMSSGPPMSHLAQLNRARARKGFAPLSLEPRPYPSGGNTSGVPQPSNLVYAR